MPQVDSQLSFDDAFSESYLRAIFEDRLKDAKFTGLDGISAPSFNRILESEVALISKKAINGTFLFTRYREKLILKSSQKPPRQISIPTIRDAIALRALCDHLTSQFRNCRMKPPHNCTKRVAEATKQANAFESFLRLDIVDFYPSINQEILLRQLQYKGANAAAISLISKAIQNPTGFDIKSQPDTGVPQGLSISNILSMIYLQEFDELFNHKYQYFRYVDDILLIVKNDKAIEIHDEISEYLQSKLKLTTHKIDQNKLDKTSISSVISGTEYLGYHISRTKLSIRERSYKKMFRAIVGCLRPLKGTARVEQIIWRLNLIITGCRIEERSVGWVFFFRQSTDIGQFHRMDVFVRQQLKIYGLKDFIPSVKKFSKSYHETRYNRDNTNYIPNFDHFTLADMVKSICLVKGLSEKKIGAMERVEIEEMYWKMVKREVAKLERETVDFLSYSS